MRIATPAKIDFKIKNVTGDKEGHYIMIQGSIQPENITFVNIYVPNIGAPKYKIGRASCRERV